MRRTACGFANKGCAAGTGSFSVNEEPCRSLLVLLGLERSAILSSHIGKVVLARNFYTTSLPITVQTLEKAGMLHNTLMFSMLKGR
eukprot:1542968-Amphidinium_carterae.1